MIRGACHCGTIRFTFDNPDPGAAIAVRKCGCTFCVKHGGVWTSHRDAALAVEISDESLVSRYRFGTKTADFCVCSVCGVVPYVTCRIDGREYAVVNVNTFENRNGLAFRELSSNFDGEGTDDRLDRRKRNWIPNVQTKIPGSNT